MSFGDYLENEILDHVFGAATYTPTPTIHVGLSTTTPNDDGTNVTEPAGGSYARVAVTNNLTNWPAASGGQKSNGTVITFPTATASWGTATYVVLYDNEAPANFLGYGALTPSKVIDNGDTAYFPVGTLTVQID